MSQTSSNPRLQNIRIVLVEPFHPGNIGSSARAMKNMGLTNLYLVKPRYFPSEEATTMAVSASDVLDNAVVVDSTFEAIKDCSAVFASTARERGYDKPMLEPWEMAESLIHNAQLGPVAILFGPERMGLSNEDIALAKYRVTIPTSPDYSSLNLAQAVQTLSYEVYKTYYQQQGLQSERLARDLPSTEDMERFYTHLESVLFETGFIIKNHPGEVMEKFRCFYDRAELDQTELNMMRGMLSSVNRSIED